MKKTKLTKEGFAKLKTELLQLKESKRPQAVERLQKARAMGDLSESSEYQAAKEELAFIEGRIQEIEEILKNVQIINHTQNHDRVELGSTVVVEVNGRKDEFSIVGEFEADPASKKLSIDSPIGKALLNRSVHEEVEVLVPAGKLKYKILQIK